MSGYVRVPIWTKLVPYLVDVRVPIWTAVRTCAMSAYMVDVRVPIWTELVPCLVYKLHIIMCSYLNISQQWGTVDAEIKDPRGVSPGLSMVPSF